MINLIDYLLYRARLDPNAPALRSSRQEISYAAMARNVRQVAAALRREGIRPGQTVAMLLPNKELGWMFTLALFHEATANCYLGRRQHDLSFEPDWLLADSAEGLKAAPRACATLVVDRAWMEAAVATPATDIAPHSYPTPEAPARIFLTSGTTGRPKAVAMGTRMLSDRARTTVASRGTSPGISTLGFGTLADFTQCLATLVSGTPLYVANHAREAIEVIRRYEVSSLSCAPAQLAQFLQEMSRSGEGLPSIKRVRTAGASLPRQVLELTQRRLTRNVIANYGSTEAGGGCTYRPTLDTPPATAGYPQPEVEVEVVDEADQPLPVGEVGAVRVRTPRMVHEYWRDPEQTAKSFRHGWFYPGDRGYMSADGMLMLEGRQSDLVNFGGMKVDLTMIDRVLAEMPGIADGAAFAIVDGLGVEHLSVAVAGAPDTDLHALRLALAAKLPAHWEVREFFVVPQIPRNDMGKVVRTELREAGHAQLAARRANR